MFGRAVFELSELKEAVATYIARAAEKLRRQHSAAGTLSIFLVNNDKTTYNEYSPSSKSTYVILPTHTYLTNILIAQAMPLVERLYSKGSKYIKAGIILSNIIPCDMVQYNILKNPKAVKRKNSCIR